MLEPRPHEDFRTLMVLLCFTFAAFFAGGFVLVLTARFLDWGRAVNLPGGAVAAGIGMAQAVNAWPRTSNYRLFGLLLCPFAALIGHYFFSKVLT